MLLEVRFVTPTLEVSGPNASLGAFEGFTVDVVHKIPMPVTSVVQLAGNAGATTPSKFSVHGAAGAGPDQVNLRPEAGNTVGEIVQVAEFIALAVVAAQSVVVVRELKSVAVVPPRPTWHVLVPANVHVPKFTFTVFNVSFSTIWKLMFSPVVANRLYPVH